MSAIVHTRNTQALLSDLSSENGLQRRQARLNLTEIGTRVVPELIALLAHGNSSARWEAAKALRDIADPSAAPALVKALEDEDAGVRWLAAEALVALGEAGLPPLLEALTRRANSYWLREGAHHVLRNYSHMNGPLANVLAALNNLEPDLEVPWAADAALRALSKRARKRIKIRAPHH